MFIKAPSTNSFFVGPGPPMMIPFNSFLFRNNSVFKITDKLENSNMEEVSKAVENQKKKKEVEGIFGRFV